MIFEFKQRTIALKYVLIFLLTAVNPLFTAEDTNSVDPYQVGQDFLDFDWEGAAKKYKNAADNFSGSYIFGSNNNQLISENDTGATQKNDLKITDKENKDKPDIYILGNDAKLHIYPNNPKIAASTSSNDPLHGSLQLEINRIFEKLMQDLGGDQSKLEVMNSLIPNKVNNIIEQINKFSLEKSIVNKFPNRLLLYGPPGTGKSTIPKVIAQETNSRLIEIKATGLVQIYSGSGTVGIDKFFLEIFNYIAQDMKKNRVVIFIDEIDAIAMNTNNPEKAQHKVTLQHLWLMLDKIALMPHIFVVVASNQFKTLDATFLSRFTTSALKIDNPDNPTKRKLINFYVEKINKDYDKDFKLNELTISSIILLKSVHPRAIENIVYALQRGEKLEELIKFYNSLPVFEENPTNPNGPTFWDKTFDRGWKVGTLVLGAAGVIIKYIDYKKAAEKTAEEAKKQIQLIAEKAVEIIRSNL